MKIDLNLFNELAQGDSFNYVVATLTRIIWYCNMLDGFSCCSK
jgi:hypothetical protein